MYFLYLRVINTEYKEDILLALESSEIYRASLVEGINLDNALTTEIPTP